MVGQSGHWLAGGKNARAVGVAAGPTVTYPVTRPATAVRMKVGFKAAVNRAGINDLHATILAMLGLNHEKLTYRYNGRDFRLTDNFGKVVDKVIA